MTADYQIYESLLNLPEIRVQSITLSDEQVDIEIESRFKQGYCPRCLGQCERVRQTYQRTIRDLPISGRRVWLHLRTRQFECARCEHYFYEQFQFVAKQGQLTQRYEAYVYQRCLGADIQYVAVKEDLCWKVVHRIFKQWGQRELDALERWAHVQALGIDEIQYHNGEYVCVLVDLDCALILDILPERTQEYLCGYFQRLGTAVCARILIFSSDMWIGYIKMAETMFPNAQIVVDRFHFFGHLQAALDKCRKSLRKLYPTHEALKGIKWLLIKNKETLSEAELAHLRRLFAHPEFAELKQLYSARNALRDILEEATDSQQGAQRLALWEAKVSSWHNRHLDAFLKTFRRWKPYILPYFDSRYSNGVVEGLNNFIKALKRRAFGFANFDHFRLRVLLEAADLH